MNGTEASGTAPSLIRSGRATCRLMARRIACRRVPDVLFVSYSGILGGAERVLLESAAALQDSVVIACPPGQLAQHARAAGLPVLALPARGVVLRGGARTRVRALIALAEHGLQVRRLSRALEPRLIVTWGMRSAIAWRAGSSGTAGGDRAP